MTKRIRDIRSVEDIALNAGISKDKLDQRMRSDVLVAKPSETSVDQAQLRRELMSQFTKTLAYLAK